MVENETFKKISITQKKIFYILKPKDNLPKDIRYL